VHGCDAAQGCCSACGRGPARARMDAARTSAAGMAGVGAISAPHACHAPYLVHKLKYSRYLCNPFALASTLDDALGSFSAVC
jgi:hypothetical protein